MCWRRCLYLTIGVGFTSWFILSKLNEMNGPFDELSWAGMLLNFAPGISLVLFGGIIMLDYWHILNNFSIYLNFHPPVYTFRGMGCIFFVVGLIILGSGILYLLGY